MGGQRIFMGMGEGRGVLVEAYTYYNLELGRGK